MTKKNRLFITSALIAVISLNLSAQNANVPRIVNIMNFIRQVEPRDAAITENILYETVHQQLLQSTY